MNWLEVKGSEGKYFISDNGKVYSNIQGKVMRTFLNNSGYECIKLVIGKVSRHFTIHRLVAEHFVDGQTEGLVVNHIDGNKLNNTASNLEWVTIKENVYDMVRRGVINYTKAQETAKEKNKKKVVQMTMEGEEIRLFDSLKEAKEYTGACHISSVVNGHRRSSGGFKWKLAKVQDDDIV